MRNAARSEDFNWQRKKVYLLINPVFKEFHGIHEVAFSHRHDQIDGVEVFLTIKTSCQVCFMVGGGMKVAAQRAAEPQYCVYVAYLKVQ